VKNKGNWRKRVIFREQYKKVVQRGFEGCAEEILKLVQKSINIEIGWVAAC
jgi:hypothetical protein